MLAKIIVGRLWRTVNVPWSLGKGCIHRPRGSFTNLEQLPPDRLSFQADTQGFFSIEVPVNDTSHIAFSYLVEYPNRDKFYIDVLSSDPSPVEISVLRDRWLLAHPDADDVELLAPGFGTIKANQILVDPPISGLTASEVYAALAELRTLVGAATGTSPLAGQVALSPAIAGLPGNVQGAIGELDTRSRDSQFAFSWGDATPSQILIAASNQLVRTVTIAILDPLNGANPRLSVGDAADPERLFPADAVIPTEGQTEWEYTPNHRYASQTPVLLSITPDGSTQGNGLVFIKRV